MNFAQKAKKFSAKPFAVTARDAFIVTAVTLFVTILLTWIYIKATGGQMSSADWKKLAGQTIAVSMGAQFAYEYSGINNMIAESSIRYAAGSTLSKYSGRRSALICDIFSAISEANSEGKISVDMAAVEKNRKILKAAVENPSWLRARGRKISKIAPADSPIHDVIAADIPEYILDHLSAGLCADILLNGIEPLGVVPRFLIFSREDEQTASRTVRGEEFLQKIGFE